MDVYKKATEFAKKLLSVYFVEQDLDAFIGMMDKNLSWIGENYHNYDQLKELLDEVKKTALTSYKLIEQWCEAEEIDDNHFVVYGEFAVEDEKRIKKNAKFSMIVDLKSMKLLHAHVSIQKYNKIFEHNVILENKLKDNIKLLQEKSTEIEALTDNITSAIIRCDFSNDYVIRYANEGFFKMIGYSKEEFKEKFHNSLSKIFYSEDSYRLVEHARKKMLKDNLFECTYRIICKDKTVLWVLGKGKCVCTQDGSIEFQGILTDVTKRKILEDELYIIYNCVDFGIIKCTLSEKGKLQFANEKAMKMLGYTPKKYKEEYGDNICGIAFLLNDQTKEKIKKKLRGVGDQIRFQANIVHKNGEAIRLAVDGAVVADQNYQNVAVYTFRDITEEEENKKLIESKNKELLLSEKRYQIAMQNNNVIIFDYSIKEKKILSPRGQKKLHDVFGSDGSKIEQIIADGWIHPNYIDRMRQMYQKIDDGAKSASAKLVGIMPDGAERVYELRLTNIFDEIGKTAIAVGVCKDITELSLLSKESRYAKVLSSDKIFAFEANISQNRIFQFDKNWAQSIGVPEIAEFEAFSEYFKEHIVYKDDAVKFSKFMNISNIKKAVESGRNQIVLDYRRINRYKVALWVRNTLSIVKDEMTGDIIVRCYIAYINELKEKELRAKEEQHFYEAIMSDVEHVYEINITQNRYLKGHEIWKKLKGIEMSDSYTQILKAVEQQAIYPDDVQEFDRCQSRKNLIALFAAGRYETYCEYRRLNKNGNYVWCSCSMHVTEDVYSGDLKGFCYIKNINEDKLKEIDLVFKAQHDLLTGLYNKETTQQIVDSFLMTPEGKTGKHAFLMFDVDNFKAINDKFGHIFGDAILSKLSKKIQELFRECDILGRIGGDEFVVLMKNIEKKDVIVSKAKEICKALKETYTKSGEKYHIYCSVGIATYPSDAESYQKLYECSDMALYDAKNNGKNQYSFYKSGMIMTQSKVDVIDEDLFERKTFADNIVEYIFRILYETPNKIDAINSVLELVGKHYGTGRMCICEDTQNGSCVSNTFEWCSEETASQIENLQNIPYEKLGDYKSNFSKQGVYYLADINDASKELKSFLEPQNIKSLLQFAIIKNSQIVGFVGFDVRESRIPTKKEITEMRNIANILGVFIIEMRALSMNEAAKDAALSIVDGLDSYAYVINSSTYQLLFINKKTRELISDLEIGDYCYEKLWGIKEPCKDCPMNLLKDEKGSKASITLHNTLQNKWVKASASWLNWMQDTKSCLVESVDISEYMQENEFEE
ncbi:MAG: diguanylate cyclase [Christensenellaceae bacterium]